MFSAALPLAVKLHASLYLVSDPRCCAIDFTGLGKRVLAALKISISEMQARPRLFVTILAAALVLQLASAFMGANDSYGTVSSLKKLSDKVKPAATSTPHVHQHHVHVHVKVCAGASSRGGSLEGQRPRQSLRSRCVHPCLQ